MNFLLAILLLGVGFLIGNIAPKIKIEGMDKLKKKRHANTPETTITDTLNKMLKDEKKEGRSLPPPPPRRTSIKPGHIKPGFSYASDTFVNVNECRDCGVIAREYDMFTMSPCPSCGGSVKRSGAAKWGVVDGMKQWIRPEHKKPV